MPEHPIEIPGQDIRAGGVPVRMVRYRDAVPAVTQKPIMAIERVIAVGRHSRDGGRTTQENAQDHFLATSMDMAKVDRLVRAKGWTVVDAVTHLDSTSVRFNRLRSIIDQIKVGTVNAIVVAELSRFGRGLEALAPIEEIRLAGGHLIVASDPHWNIHNESDLRSMRDELIFLGRARDKWRDKWREVDEALVERGIAKSVPFGYARRTEPFEAANGTRSPVGSAYIPDHARALAADLVIAFEKMDLGLNDGTIARWLHERGHRQSNGALITRATVHCLRESPIAYGAVKNGPFLKEGCHEALVSKELWERVQVPHRTVKRRTSTNTQMLSGIMRCAGCRRRLIYSAAYRNEKKSAQRGTPVWQSASYHHPASAWDCHLPASVKQTSAETYVEDVFLSWVRHHQEAIPKARLSSARAKQELEELLAARDATALRLRDHLGDWKLERADPEMYTVRRNVFRDEAMAASEAYDLALLAMPSAMPDGDILVAWPAMTPSERRDMIARVFPIVFLRRADFIDEEGARRRMPLADRFLFVKPVEAAGLDLPRQGVATPQDGRPMTDGWTKHYELAPRHSSRRPQKVIWYQSERYVDIKGRTTADLEERERARDHFVTQGRTDAEIREAFAFCGGVKRQVSIQIGIPIGALHAKLLRLGLVAAEEISVIEKAKQKRYRERGGSHAVTEEETLAALSLGDGDVKLAAKELGMPVQTLYSRARAYRKRGLIDDRNIPINPV